jgi:hypothetical protein
MSICNERRGAAPLDLASAGLSIYCLLLVACFDVREVAVKLGPLPLEIDDFEDGDDLPSSSLFANWHCEAGPGPPASCAPQPPGFESGLAEAVMFEIEDPLNQATDYPGVLLEAPAQLGTLDLSSYESLAFSAKFEPTPAAEETSSADTTLFLQLRCDGVGTSGAQSDGSWIETSTSVGPEWSSPTLALSKFARPSYVISFSKEECMARVEALQFILAPDLPDGGQLSGTLSIDQVTLQ